ncbi:caspase family protein, partial [bacterium]|nr:caspase family protein [bacterium]
RILSISLAVILAVSAGLVDCGGEELPTEAPGSEEIALRFLEKVAVTPSSLVYVFGPVEPGTVVREDAPLNATAVELEVPEALGTNYVFVIDDMPDYKFAHPMRYVWMEYERGETEVVDASWWPVILEPETEPSPFEFISVLEIQDIQFIAGKGSGGGVEHDISDKPDATAPEISKPEECQNRKFALIIDAGEKRSVIFGGIPGPTAADNMADDATDMAKWLKDKGYQVQRISQYWGNKEPTIKEHFSEKLEEIFNAYAKGLRCCDSFFLYISAHAEEADKNGFLMYEPSGKGVGLIWVPYSVLYGWLNKFANCTKITIFIDACYSGAAIEDLKKLRDNHSKVVIITSADDSHECPSGQTIDSATEDFNDEPDKDNDGDGKNGDLGDRIQEMQEQGKSYNPQADKGDYASFCDLD